MTCRYALCSDIFPLKLYFSKLFLYFTQIVSGHLQIDNCTFENSHIKIEHPGTCHFRYCAFQAVHLHLYHVNTSLIENCDFKQCGVHVVGGPKETRNWAHSHLSPLITRLWSNSEQTSYLYGGCAGDAIGADGFYESTINTTHSLYNASSAFEVNKSEVDSIGVASIDCRSQGSDPRAHARRPADDNTTHSSLMSNSSFCSFSSLSSHDEDNNNKDDTKPGANIDTNHHAVTSANDKLDSVTTHLADGELAATCSHNDVKSDNNNTHLQPSVSQQNGAADDSRVSADDSHNVADDSHNVADVSHGSSTSGFYSRAVSISSKCKLTAENLPTVEELENASVDSCSESSYESSSPSLFDQQGRH